MNYIETFAGNHHAQNGEREYQAKGTCKNCGNLFQEITWCVKYNERCGNECPDETCETYETRLYCRKCNTTVEMED